MRNPSPTDAQVHTLSIVADWSEYGSGITARELAGVLWDDTSCQPAATARARLSVLRRRGWAEMEADGRWKVTLPGHMVFDRSAS